METIKQGLLGLFVPAQSRFKTYYDESDYPAEPSDGLFVQKTVFLLRRGALVFWVHLQSRNSMACLFLMPYSGHIPICSRLIMQALILSP